LKYCIISDI